MIITKYVLATVSGRNKKHYEDKGYKLPYRKDERGRVGIKKGSKIKVSVYDIHPNSSLKIQYKCDDCGVIKTVNAGTIMGRKNSQYLKDGKTYCSKCANKLMSGKNSGAYKHGSVRYPEYRNNAKRRGIDFNLTIKEFKYLTSQPCYYCGGDSKETVKNSRGNGIDRVDSNKGYTIDNCVPCCAFCNFIKNNVSYDFFINKIKKIYERRIKGEI